VRVPVVLIASLLAVLWVAPARAELLVVSDLPSPVAAINGTVLLSEYHADPGRWELETVRPDASVVVIGAAGRRDGPWDADLGTGASGALVATWMDSGQAVVAPIEGGTARRYALPKGAVSPSMWHGRLAYARRDRLYSGKPGGPYKRRAWVKGYVLSDVDLGSEGALALATRGERTRVVLDDRTLAGAPGDEHVLSSPGWDGNVAVYAEHRPANPDGTVLPCDCVQMVRPAKKLVRAPEQRLCLESPIVAVARQDGLSWVTEQQGRVWRLPAGEDLCI
jgi:hypothetical protein